MFHFKGKSQTSAKSAKKRPCKVEVKKPESEEDEEDDDQR